MTKPLDRSSGDGVVVFRPIAASEFVPWLPELPKFCSFSESSTRCLLAGVGKPSYRTAAPRGRSCVGS